MEMAQATLWAEPSLAERRNGGSHEEPDLETLLAELGAFYPMVSYPAQEEAEEALDESIFAGLVWP
jgi:hypothetical protein